MILRPSREKRGEDPQLQLKMLVFVAGAVVALTGIATGRDWLVWIAIVIFAVGMLLRFLRRSPDAGSEDQHSEDQHSEDQHSEDQHSDE